MGSDGTNRRECNGCTACCTAMLVPELDKGNYIPCHHEAGGHCSIYRDRPNSCKDYYCEWARGTTPEWMKPNKCGIIPGHTEGHDRMQFAEVWSGASDSVRIQDFIRAANAQGIEVAIMAYRAPDESKKPNRLYLRDGKVIEFFGEEHRFHNDG